MATRRRARRIRGLKGLGAICKATKKRATYPSGQLRPSCYRVVAGGKTTFSCPCSTRRKAAKKVRKASTGRKKACLTATGKLKKGYRFAKGGRCVKSKKR